METKDINNCCIAVAKVPITLTKNILIERIEERSDSSVERWTAVEGAENNINFERLLFQLSSHKGVTKLYEDVKQEELEHDGECYTLFYEKCIPCEIPLEWEDDLEVDGDTDPTEKPQASQNPGTQAGGPGNLPNLSHMTPNQTIYQNFPNMSQGGQPNMPPGAFQHLFQMPQMQGMPPNVQFPFPFGMPQQSQPPPADGQQPEQQPQPIMFDPRMMHLMQQHFMGIPPPRHGPGDGQEPPPPYTSGGEQMLGPSNPEEETEIKQRDGEKKHGSLGYQAVLDQDEQIKRIQDKGKREEKRSYGTNNNSSGGNEEERMEEDEEEVKEETIKTNKIVLKDLPEEAHEEFIQLFFEKKKFGGFDVEVERDYELSMALVVFSDAEGVDKVRQQEPIVMLKKQVRVKPYIEVEEEDEPLCTIVVCGLDNVDDETIEMYFENEKRANGGEIEKLDYREEEGKAFITYKTEEVARQVVAKRKHVLVGQSLEVTLWEPPRKKTWNVPSPEPEPEELPLDTIVVQGIGDSLDQETLEMYFENTKRSGGDEIRDMKMAKDVVYITYFAEEVASRVVNKSPHVLNKHELDVVLMTRANQHQSSHAREPSPEPVRSVEVYGIDASLDEQTLEMYFENTKRSGGGDIEEIQIDFNEGVAYITYKEALVAERVAQKGNHQLSKKILNVVLAAPSTSKEAQLSLPEEEPKCTIEVHGLSPSIDEETLEMYFENSKRSGGDEIVKQDIRDDVAYIEYKSEEVAQRVVDHGNHKINKRQLTVKIHVKPGKTLKPKPARRPAATPEKSMESYKTAEEEDAPSPMVKVKGVKRVKSVEAMKYYFENRRRSGGDEIANFAHHEEDDDVVFITFADHQVASRVAEREHIVENVDLKVTVHIPPKPRPFYNDKLLIRGLRNTTTKDCLFNFLEAKSKSVPIDLQRGEREGVVLIIFDDEPDFAKLKAVCDRTKLEGATLEVAQVEITNSIIVINIPEDTTKDTIMFYFENKKRSNGGEVDKVVMREEECSCLVYFMDYEVVDRVVTSKHNINGQDVIVKIFLECLGCPQGDTAEMPFKRPDPIVIKDIHQKIVKFLKNSEVNRKAIGTQMDAVNATVIWPEKSSKDTNVVIKCTLTKEMKSARQLAKSWKQNAGKNFDDFMKNVVIEQIMVLPEHWNTVMEKVKLVQIPNPDGVGVLADREQGSVGVVGLKSIVEQVAKDISNILKEIEAEVEREKEKVKEQLTNLRLIETKMLLAEKYPNKMETKYEGLKVKINQNKNEITFEGIMRDVNAAKVELFEMKEKFASTSVDMTGSKSRFDLYDSKMAKEYIVKKLKTGHVTAVWEVKNQKLVVCSTKEETIDKSVELVKDCIVEHSISLTKENQDVVRTESWRTMVDEQNQKYPGKTKVEVQGSVAYVCGTDDIIQDVLGVVKKLLKNHTIIEDHVDFGKDINRLIEKDHKEEISSISKKYASLNTQVIPRANNTGFTLRGTTEGVENAKKDLKGVKSRVQKRDHTLQGPGIRDHMDQKGPEHKTTIEKRSPVVFGSLDEDEENPYEELPGLPYDGPRIHAACSIYDDRKIYTAEGDMTDLAVDVLVHPADSKLSLTGGLGKAMVDKGGKAILDACKAYIRDEGELGEGEAFVSQAGRLKAKYIVHIVGPVWNDGTKNEESLLLESVLKSMKQATVKNVESIAIPAISCGVYGFPLRRATKVIVQAVKNFFREIQESQIMKVYLCDVKTKTVEGFTDALSNEFGQHNLEILPVKPMQTRPPQVPKPRGSGNYATNIGMGGARYKKSPDFSSPHTMQPDSKHGEARIGNISVTVVKGEIARQNVDVIVNTTARNLDLKNGAVSTSLLRAAGSRLQEEVNRNYPNGIKDGEIAVSSGQDLKCKIIIHTSLMNWDSKNKQAKKALHTLMENCLHEADSKMHQSIAFPAIGTGNLGFPRDVVAREMFTVIANFERDNPNTSISDVRFIVYQKDTGTISAFDNEKKNWMSGDSRRQSRKIEPAYQNLREVSRDEDSDSDGSGSYEEIGDRVIEEDEDDDDQVKPLTVTVEKGDITKVTSDCIVNSSNDSLDLSKGAVSQALMRTGGSQLQSECRTKAKKMKSDGIVMTGAPGFPFKWIIHVVAQDSTKSWKRMVDRCFQMAEEKKIRSIAFPALGTNLQANANDIAEAMVNSLREFEAKPHEYLQEVQFIIFQEKMVDTFKKAMDKTTKPKQGFLRSMLGYAGFGATPKHTGTRKSVRKAKQTTPVKADHPDKYKIRLYSLSSKAISDAIENLEKIISNEVQRQVFKDELLENFQSHKQRNEIQKLEKECGVQIQFKGKTELEVIGMVQNVMNASNKIHSMIRQLDKMEQQKLEAERIKRLVQWFFIDITEVKQELIKYEPNVNLLIENAFNGGEKKVSFSDNKGQKYIIDFNKMLEYPEGNAEDVVNVIRRDLMKEGSFETPVTWVEMRDENLKVVTLQTDDQEYQDISKQFMVSVNSSNYVVSRIDRIQNKTLWRQYQAKKQYLESTNKGVKNESLLWHGTSCEGVDSINANGFNRSYCGKNATAFGDGVYFAVNASYSCSDTYSRPDSSGLKRMYLCHVLTGEYVVGKSGMRVPPAKSDKASSSLYDSVVNNASNPSMFVIFNDTQAYPQYLIFFKKKG